MRASQVPRTIPALSIPRDHRSGSPMSGRCAVLHFILDVGCTAGFPIKEVVILDQIKHLFRKPAPCLIAWYQEKVSFGEPPLGIFSRLGL